MVKPKTFAMTDWPLHAPELGELLVDEGAHADVLQADGVDHAGGGLDDARRGVAGHRLAREALGDEAADAVERDDVLELDPVAEGSAGCDDGRAKLDAGYGDAHVWTFAGPWRLGVRTSDSGGTEFPSI